MVLPAWPQRRSLGVMKLAKTWRAILIFIPVAAGLLFFSLAAATALSGVLSRTLTAMILAPGTVQASAVDVDAGDAKATLAGPQSLDEVLAFATGARNPDWRGRRWNHPQHEPSGTPGPWRHYHAFFIPRWPGQSYRASGWPGILDQNREAPQIGTF